MTTTTTEPTTCPHIHRNDDDHCPCADPATCDEPGCFDYAVEGETTCLTHTYDPFEVETWNER